MSYRTCSQKWNALNGQSASILILFECFSALARTWNFKMALSLFLSKTLCAQSWKSICSISKWAHSGISIFCHFLQEIVFKIFFFIVFRDLRFCSSSKDSKLSNFAPECIKAKLQHPVWLFLDLPNPPDNVLQLQSAAVQQWRWWQQFANFLLERFKNYFKCICLQSIDDWVTNFDSASLRPFGKDSDSMSV